MQRTAIQQTEALRLLHDGQPHLIRVWKLSTGDILEYRNATYRGGNRRGGTTRVLLHPSGQIREFRNITLHHIDGLAIYL